MIPLYEISRVVKYIDIEISVVIARGWQEGEMGSYCLMCTEFPFGKMKKLWRFMERRVTQQCECTYALLVCNLVPVYRGQGEAEERGRPLQMGRWWI